MDPSQPLCDVQRTNPDVEYYIEAVGIDGFQMPVRVRDPARGSQAALATVRLTTDLPPEVRGSHLSRLCAAALHRLEADVVDLSSVETLLRDAAARLRASRADAEIRFTYSLRKEAPVSGCPSWITCPARLGGSLEDGRVDLYVEAGVTYVSLCPCSKAISSHGAHSQRSVVSIRAWPAGDLWIDDLVSIAERRASCAVRNLLKRPDEKYVTETSYATPRFAEDMLRLTCADLAADPRVDRFRVKCAHQESVHQFDVIAESGGSGGARAPARVGGPDGGGSE